VGVFAWEEIYDVKEILVGCDYDFANLVAGGVFAEQ
jgi:hypothetical protein